VTSGHSRPDRQARRRAHSKEQAGRWIPDCQDHRDRTVEIPELGDISHLGETHPLIEEMYESMKQSASVKFFEPTDWQFARLTLYTLNQELIAAQHNGKPVGAMKLTAINQMLSALLLTEGDRRRARIEIE